MLAARLLMMAAAGRNGGVQPVWNSADKDGDIALSGSDLIATSSNAGAVRSTVAKSAGLRYVEFVALTSANSQNWVVGLANATHAITVRPGQTSGGTNSWGFAGDGTKRSGGSGSAYASALTDGDIVGLAYNASTGKLWFSVNNTFDGDPAAGTGEAFSGLSGDLFLCWGTDNATRACTIKTIATYSYTPPAGFTKGW